MDKLIISLYERAGALDSGECAAQAVGHRARGRKQLRGVGGGVGECTSFVDSEVRAAVN